MTENAKNLAKNVLILVLTVLLLAIGCQFAPSQAGTEEKLPVEQQIVLRGVGVGVFVASNSKNGSKSADFDANLAENGMVSVLEHEKAGVCEVFFVVREL